MLVASLQYLSLCYILLWYDLICKSQYLSTSAGEGGAIYQVTYAQSDITEGLTVPLDHE